MITKTTHGTCHFASLTDATVYYRPYGYDRAAVVNKLNAGEIHIGRPSVAENQIISIDSDGRYHITTYQETNTHE